MLKQRDADGTIHLVLTPQEIVDAQAVLDAAMTLAEFGMTRLFEPEIKFIQDMTAAAYLLSDEEIIEAKIQVHLGHGDDIEKMKELLRESLPVTRAAAQEKGLLSA